MGDDDWSRFHARWSRLRPPLRPDADVVRGLAEAVRGHDERVLLLGVTPELTAIGERLTAVDWSEPMVRNVWPGDTPGRRALLCDWLAMPAPSPRHTAAIGDGSLNAIRFDQWPALFGRLADVLEPGSRIAFRVYLTPGDGESLEAVRSLAHSGGIRGFHAFKWHLAMAVATERRDPQVPVTRIHEAFERAFPDRASLGRATGWSLEEIAEIDAYRDGAAVFCFPTGTQALAAIPAAFRGARFVAAGRYELAARCPLLVADRAP